MLSHDVTAAMLVRQINEAEVMLVYKTNLVGVQPLSYVNTLLFQYIFIAARHVSENAL